MSEKKKKKNLPEGYLAVYRPHFLIQIMSIVLLVLVTLGILPIGFEWANIERDPLFFLLWGCLVAFMLWSMFMTVARDKLAITEDGVVWWKYGFKKQASWDELTRFRVYTRNKSRMGGIQIQSGNFIPLGDYVHVRITNVSMFRRKVDRERFSQTKAGSYFYQYAPHLFDEQKEKSKHDLNASAYHDQLEQDLYADEAPLYATNRK